MTPQNPSTPVGKMFIRWAQSAVAGAAVSYAANHYAVVPVLQSVARAVLRHEALVGPEVGKRLLMVFAVAALLFAASIATEKRRNAFLDAVASRGRRLADWLLAAGWCCGEGLFRLRRAGGFRRSRLARWPADTRDVRRRSAVRQASGHDCPDASDIPVVVRPFSCRSS